MSAAPPISIVIAVHNGAPTMQRCLDSISGQVGIAAEVTVMDGGSSDGTVEILERNGQHIAFWESEPDRGICHAWNKAVEHARGDWVMFLGADDRLAAPDVLSRAASRLAEVNPAVSIAYGRVDLVDPDDQIVGEAGRAWSEARTEFYLHNTIPHQGVFHRRELFDRLGPFSEDFRILGDYEMLVRAIQEHEPEFLDLTVVRFACGGLSEHPEMMYRATQEAYRARRINGLERWPERISPRVLRAAAFEVVRRTAGPDVARSLADRYHRRGQAKANDE